MFLQNVSTTDTLQKMKSMFNVFVKKQVLQ